jgi:signal transduction histidine kinase
MYSTQSEGPMRSAAWRISLWATVAFAFGAMLVFVMLHRFVAGDIQRRNDAWISGAVEELSDVAKHTPKDKLYGRALGEVAELASKEVPDRPLSSEGDDDADAENDSVFFLQADHSSTPQLWVGSGDGTQTLHAIRSAARPSDAPYDVRVPGFEVPFRVAAVEMADGSMIYLGLSERDELHVLHALQIRFFSLWLLIVLFSFAIVFYVTRRMLNDVLRITEAASTIGESDLRRRVPVNDRQDEVAHLALTLNRMLDRIESSMHQLHTMTDALAHDLRSPLTAIRGKLEVALSRGMGVQQAEPVVAVIDELDRLTEFLNKTLDVAEARADALRLTLTAVELDQLMRVMIDLYEPGMLEKGIHVHLRSVEPVWISADAALLHRAIANLLDNELKHLPDGCNVTITLQAQEDGACIVIEDDGPGFTAEILPQVFVGRVKGGASSGHGLGLAFVEAVARAHGGSARATNLPQGGVQLTISWPLLASAGTAEDERTPVA